jgi:hypothetical protein
MLFPRLSAYPQRRRHASNNLSDIFGPHFRIVCAFADHGLCRVSKPEVNPRRTTARKLDAVLPKHFRCRINENELEECQARFAPDTIALLAAFTAISVAATVAAAKAVLRSNASVPSIPGRIPCNVATCRISHTPHQPTARTSIAGEGVAATIATL